MRKFIPLLILLLPLSVKAETTWRVYISTDPPNYSASSERVLSSTGAVEVSLPVKDETVHCYAPKPYYFQPEGFPYPLGQHRLLVCYLGKEYAFAAETMCALRYDDVHAAELLMQTPNFLYGISFQCANFVDEKK